jgi:hypothetical protein
MTGTNLTPAPAHSLQYDLFCTFIGDPANLSNTVELWDAIPKYVVSARKQAWNAVKGNKLELYEQEFDYIPQPRHVGNVQHLKVTIAPARFKEPDAAGIMHVVEVFPSATEELVEEAVRKIFSDQVNGGHDAKTARVQFTLRMVRKELKARGKTRSCAEILRALRVMNGCNITLTPASGGRALIASPIFPNLAGVSRTDWLADPTSRFMVTFNDLMHAAITNLAFRQLNYKTLMSLKSPLARWLFKRLSHEYLNASLMVPYTVYLSSLTRDSGYLIEPYLAHRARMLDAALAELTAADVLLSVKKDPVVADEPDYHYTLTPNPHFIGDVKAANMRTNQIADTGRQNGLMNPTTQVRGQRLAQAQAPARRPYSTGR